MHAVEHHLAHLASAFLVSPFDEAVAVSVDGFGDFASAAWGLGRGTIVAVDDRVYFPHSLGVFYQALTQFLGFPHYGDEYKVMGLAPYGEPRYLAQMRQIVPLEADGTFALDLHYFRHATARASTTRWRTAPRSSASTFARRAGETARAGARPAAPLEQRHRDIARSVQAMYEERLLPPAQRPAPALRLDAVALAGGCA